jgi:phage-related protein
MRYRVTTVWTVEVSDSEVQRPVKMVLASATDKQGELLYPRQWNHKFIDAPRVENQNRPHSPEK